MSDESVEVRMARLEEWRASQEKENDCFSKEIDSLRDDRHKSHDNMQHVSGRVALIESDKEDSKQAMKEMRIVVEANTVVMNKMTTALATLVTLGKVLIGLGTLTTIIMGVFKYAPIQ